MRWGETPEWPQTSGGETVSPTIRRDDEGEVDEVVARGADVHLERMSAGGWSLIIGDLHLEVFTKRRGAKVRTIVVEGGEDG